MKIGDMKDLEKQKGIGAEELQAMCPFEAFLLKSYRDKAKQKADVLDAMWDLGLPIKNSAGETEIKLATIRYTPLQITGVIEFLEKNGFKDDDALISNEILIKFELKKFQIGYPRPTPVSYRKITSL